MKDSQTTVRNFPPVGQGGHARRTALKLAALCLGTAILLWSAVAPVLAQPATATLATVKGSVDVRVPGSAVWEPAESGTRLAPGTLVRTGVDSAASIAITEGAVAELGAETAIGLMDNGSQLTDGEGTIVIHQFEGHIELELRLKAHHYLKSTVLTPHAAVNMRTQFRFQILKVTAGPDGTEVEVEAGEAEILAEGTTIALQPGESVSMPASNAPEHGIVGTGPSLAFAVAADGEPARSEYQSQARDGDCDQDRDQDRDRSGPGECDGGRCEEPAFGDVDPQGPAGGATGPGEPREPGGPNGPNGPDEVSPEAPGGLGEGPGPVRHEAGSRGQSSGGNRG